MKIFGVCIFHNWKYKEVYYDYSDICMWSSGTEYYRQCKCCNKTQMRGYWEKRYISTNDKNIIKLFKKENK